MLRVLKWALVCVGLAGSSLIAAPSGPPAGLFILNISTSANPKSQVFSVSSGTVTSQINLPYLTSGQCLTVNSAGNVGSTPCGGGAASIALTTGTASGFSSVTSSPTAVVNFDSSTFVIQLKGGATAYVTLLNSYLTTSSATATYLQDSSATLTYLQISSATANYLTLSSATATYFQNSGILAVAHGGTGTSFPGLVAGTNIGSITGTWPNQTINASSNLVTSTASVTTGHCAQFSNSTGLIDAGASCGTGGSSSGTVTASPQFQLPYYSIPGTNNIVQGDPDISTSGSGNLTVTTNTATAALLGNASATNGPNGSSLTHGAYVTVKSSGTSQALTVISNGNPSGGAQNQIGAVNVYGPNFPSDSGNSSALLVVADSTTNNSNGAALIEIWEDNPAHDAYLMDIHGSSTRNSDEPLRFDGPTFGIDEVSSSTDSAHGLGKWKVISEGYQAVDSQLASSRAWDNSTFENVVFVHRLDAADFPPGVYLTAQNLADDSAVLTSSDTAAFGWTTLNGRTVGLTGPQNATASWTFALPSTFNNQGQVLYQSDNGRGNNFNARSWAFTTGGSTGQFLTYNSGSAPTWSNGVTIYPATATAIFPFGSTVTLTATTAVPLTVNNSNFAGPYNVGIGFDFGSATFSYLMQANSTTLCSDLSTPCATNPLAFGAGTNTASQLFDVGTDGHVSIGAFAASASTLTVSGNVLIGAGYGANTPTKGPPNGLRTEGNVIFDSGLLVGSNLANFDAVNNAINIGGGTEDPDSWVTIPMDIANGGSAIHVEGSGSSLYAFQVSTTSYDTLGLYIIGNSSATAYGTLTPDTTFQMKVVSNGSNYPNLSLVSSSAGGSNVNVGISGTGVSISSSIFVTGSNFTTANVASRYSVGIGTTSLNGPYQISVSTSGHFITGGSVPSVSSCGSTPNGSVVGDDNDGIITVGGTAPTACTLTFANTWGTGANVSCVVTDNSLTISDDISSLSPTTMILGFGVGGLAGGTVYYHCVCSGANCR